MVPPLDCDGPSGEDHVLLMLPASQLPGDSSSATVDSLLLLQLPAGSDLTTSDLLGGEAYVAGPGRGEVAPSLSPSLLSSQACLVVEGGAGRSYSLSKVETSNALILVPPQQPSGDLERPVKKQKAVADAPTSPQGRHMRARLLGSWGSGASFLDLRPHSLDRGLLRSMLAETVHDPYSGAAPAEAGVVADAGLSIPTLALALRVSKAQVSAALASDPTLGAFQLPPRDSGRWGTLAEEAREGGLAAIVAVLTECEAYNDAFVEGTRVSRDVPVESFVREVVRRSAEEEVGGGGLPRRGRRGALPPSLRRREERKRGGGQGSRQFRTVGRPAGPGQDRCHYRPSSLQLPDDALGRTQIPRRVAAAHALHRGAIPAQPPTS